MQLVFKEPQVTMGHLDSQEEPEIGVFLVRVELLVTQDSEEMMDSLATMVSLEHQELRAETAFLDKMVILDKGVHQGHLVTQGNKVNLEQLELLELQVCED